ncbi:MULTISPECIES: hypothetical protein [Kosakonia]|uniref:hypothetical protein n=1 Tax=Kosakonia TaxID=1330547 RepID=UPI000AB4D053|nr:MULTISPECIES: hypothetical protein [Kosakonia]
MADLHLAMCGEYVDAMKRGEDKSPARVMAAKQQTSSLISRMKAAFRRKNDAAGAE